MGAEIGLRTGATRPGPTMTSVTPPPRVGTSPLGRVVPAVAIAAVTVVAVGAVAAVSTLGHDATDDGARHASAAWSAAATWIAGVAIAARMVAFDDDRSWAWRASIVLSTAGSGALLGVSLLQVESPTVVAWAWLWPIAWAGERIVLRRGFAAHAVPPVVVAVAAGSWSASVDVTVCVAITLALLALGALVVLSVRRTLRHYARVLEQEQRDRMERERRRRANWIHDDVLSELRLARLRLETAGGDQQRVLAELGDVEHRLRLRQLDADLEIGHARLADVVQPYVRMVTRAGVAVGAVPRDEAARRLVDAATAYELQRFLGVAVPNSLLAGATVVAFEVEWHAERLVARVRDDAGGFDVRDVHAGRGRERLAAELGDHRLRTEVAEGWTAFSCEFTIGLPE